MTGLDLGFRNVQHFATRENLTKLWLPQQFDQYKSIIRYVPRERPPFSALNFRTGAYFHK